MSLKDFSIDLNEVFCEWPLSNATITIEQLPSIVQQIQQNEGQLLTLWGSDERLQTKGFCLHLVFIFWQQGVLYLQCDLPADNPAYPDLSAIFPAANRLQRALFDLLGIKAINSEDQRPWLRHGAWPEDIFPLREEIKLSDQFSQQADLYHFIPVGGEGVHEIPVGPVHAGTIEPGHFRFSVVGERVLRLEERLGYTHKGIAKHFQHATFNKGAKLACRISGDSTVAYAWAYNMAIENLHRHTVSSRAQWLRALFLERERIANHLGDLGALGNDAGLSFGLSQFSRLKEIMLRLNAELFGHRYLMDIIIPGGVTVDITSQGKNAIQQEIQMLRNEVNILKNIYAEHQGLQDRFVTTGILKSALAKRLGVLGLVARASGIAIDWRCQFTYAPYNKMNLHLITENSSDVAGRAVVRFKEIEESLRLIEIILQQISESDLQTALPRLSKSQIGFGCVEGWRGPVFFAVCNQDAEQILWAHAHDPSWQNWLALEPAMLGNIVPDFPLINKSFNLSYSGHDG
jgi:Ni,Fe-hydrogenase III large subunit/Ni,Fe-hydrogenase III component G